MSEEFVPSYQGEVPIITRMNLVVVNNDPEVEDKEIDYSYCSDDPQAHLASINYILKRIAHVAENLKPSERMEFRIYHDDEEEIDINDVCAYSMLPEGDIVCYLQFKMSAPFDGCFWRYGHVFFKANREVPSEDWPILYLDMPGKYGVAFIRFAKRSGCWSENIKDSATGFIEEGLTFGHWQKWREDGGWPFIEDDDMCFSSPRFFGNPSDSHGESGNIISIMTQLNEHSRYPYQWQCDCCWNYISENPAGFGSYHGTGGVGIEHTNPYCKSCSTEAACSKCDAKSRDYLADEKCYNCGQKCFCCGVFEEDLDPVTAELLMEHGALEETDADEHGDNIFETLCDDLGNEEMIFRDVKYANPLDWAFDTNETVTRLPETVNKPVCPACDYAHELLEKRIKADEYQMKFDFIKTPTISME